MVDKICVSSVSSSGGSHSSQSDIPGTPGPPIDERSDNDEANLDSANITVNPLPPPPPLPPSPANSSTPSKLRRRVSANDELDYKVPIQRLVEYFFVVSCRPRFDPQNKAHQQQQPHDGAARSTAPGTPELIRPPTIPRRVTPASGTPTKMPTTNQEIRLDDGEGRVPLPLTPKQATATSNKKRGIAMFKKRERTDEKENPHEEEMDGISSDYTLPSPKPRETWKREDVKEQPQTTSDEWNDDNIHLPRATKLDNHTFEPKVTARFPLEDHRDNPFNPMLTHFCFPGGDIIFPSREFHMPVVHHFVLTNDKGRKVYGTCLTVYEEYVPPENTFWKSRERLHGATVGESGIEVSVNPQYTKLYIPKVLCILSIWPYVKAFREYLAQIYRLATSTNCMEAPIERYIMNICNEIPAPPPGAFEVHLHILDSVIRFWSPPARLPIAYVALPYEILFDCLDIENIMHLWYCLTMERKVLLVSTQHSILTVCAEILCSMLYPMKWSHLYVPMLPQFLCPMLDAPVPYLCGVTRDNWMFAQHHVSDETIVVDLDRNSVMFGQNTAPLPPAPGKKWTKLHNSLQETVGNLFWRARGMEEDYQLCLQGKLKEDVFQVLARDKGDPIWRGKLKTMDQAFDLQYTPDSTHLQDDVAVDDQEQTQWDRVQEAFLRFFVALLKDYRSFLHIPDTSKLGSPSVGSSDWIEWSHKHSFDQHKFIASQKGEYTAYLSELCSTQQFDDFITKRLYSPNQPDIIFFDQSIDAKLNRSRLKLRKTQTPFLQSAKAHKQLEKFVAVKPNTIGLSRDAPFLYKYWPETFDNSLFGRPRPIPSIITAEFDRQASLAKQLRTSFASGANVTAELLELYGSDYDTNPEGMSFTVFFYTYCAVIGLEWQEYQNKRKQDEFADTVSEPTNGIDSRDRLQIDHTEEVEEAEDTDTSLFSERTYSLCDGTLCQNGKAIVDNAVIYVAANSPCPNLNYQAQAAIETLTSMAACMDPLKVQRNTSLLDTDEAFAEFEEIRDVAAAQLDLAFDALKIMGNRGLLSDPDVFKSMMEACGRCGDTKRALELIRIMKRDKLVTDNDVLVCFMASFAQYGYAEEGSPMALDKSVISGRRVRDAYSNFLRKKVLAIKGGNSVISKLPPGLLAEEDIDNGSASEGGSEGGSERSSLSGNSEQFSAPSFLQLVAPSSQISSVTKKKKNRRRKKKTSRGVTDRIQKQLLLGESLLEFLYPEIRIDTHGDTCPMCSNVMSEEDVISGWQPCEFQDLTSQCPQCTHRFVPRFKVSTTSPTFTGSQGPGTPLYCEFLSPWVIRKELGHIIGDENNVEQLLDPDWRSGRDVRATIWWNLIIMLKRYNLPFAFLLQGSFKNRLITPGPQDV